MLAERVLPNFLWEEYLEIYEEYQSLSILELVSKYNKRLSSLVWHNENQLNFWVVVLLTLSNSEANHLVNFIQKSDKELELSDPDYASCEELPRALKEYFKGYGAVCPKCGSLLNVIKYKEVGEDPIEEGIYYTCDFCDIDFNSLEDMSLGINDVPELSYLPEGDYELLRVLDSCYSEDFNNLRFTYKRKSESLFKGKKSKYCFIVITDREENSMIGNISADVTEDVKNANLCLDIGVLQNTVKKLLVKHNVYVDLLRELGHPLYNLEDGFECGSDKPDLKYYSSYIRYLEGNIVLFKDYLSILPKNTFNRLFIDNAYIQSLEKSDKLLTYQELNCIFDYVIESDVEYEGMYFGYNFRVLNCDVLNKGASSLKLIQVIKNIKVVSYMLVGVAEYNNNSYFTIEYVEEGKDYMLNVNSNNVYSLCKMYTEQFEFNFHK